LVVISGIIRGKGLFWNIIKERISFAKRARESGRAL